MQFTKEAEKTAEKTTALVKKTAGKSVQTAQEKHYDSGFSDASQEKPSLSSQFVKYTLGVATVGYIYDKVSDDFFLSTTSLHDGKGGFTSNNRLEKARQQAEKYFQQHQMNASEPEPKQTPNTDNPLKLCGNNQFSTMTDYRAATKVYLDHTMDTQEVRQSMIKNLSCLKGERINQDMIAKHKPTFVPKNFDLTEHPKYSQTNKYSLSGVFNEETGANGYTSRSVTRPFINKGLKDFTDALDSEKALTPKKTIDTLQELLQQDSNFGKQTLRTAGQALLVFRPFYGEDDNWGHSEKSQMDILEKNGWLSRKETDKIESTRPFETGDMSLNPLQRNTTIIGPLLHKSDIFIQSEILKKDSETIKDMKNGHIEDLQQLPIMQWKLNNKANGFEDCSGLGDAFTCINVTMSINHARLMSAEPRLSKEEVGMIVASLNAVYDDTGSIRHTLSEIARGCFVGAGYTTEDGNQFYKDVCKAAAEKFYQGKALSLEP